MDNFIYKPYNPFDVKSIIANFRINAGMSIRELSRKSGISASTISCIECGKRNPSYMTMLILLNSLGITIDFKVI